MSKISVLGLGAMGARMAAHLIKAGHDVTVWNRTADAAKPLVAAGATQAQTPKEAAAGAAFVVAMVRDDDASRRVWLDPDNGALAGMSAGAVAIESSTLTPGWIRELGHAIAERGVALLEAPVSGSRVQADAGQLVYFVGGDDTTLARAEPVLKAMGSAVHHVVWTWAKPNGGTFANINPPVADPTHEKTLPVGPTRCSSTRWPRRTARRSRFCSKSCSPSVIPAPNTTPG